MLGPKETLVVGVGNTGRSGASVSGQGGGGFRVTGRGWVRAEGSVPEVWAEGAGPGEGDVKSSGIEVGEVDVTVNVGDLPVLLVEAGRGGCWFLYTLIFFF